MTDSRESTPQTDFGYQQVPLSEKASRVADVFHSVASKYDIMNDLMSGGIHRLWKRRAIALCGIRSGQSVLDLAGGTGDLALKIARLVGPKGHVVLSDINESMLSIGRDKLIDNNVVSQVDYVQADAEKLPFDNNAFDCVTMAFGLRNVTCKENALASIFRCLKPGGRLMVLEFSKPTDDTVAKIYDSYSFNILPKIGQWVTNDADSYQYLAESIRMHPDQETLKGMMEDAGFEDVTYENLTFGVVAIHIGYKY